MAEYIERMTAIATACKCCNKEFPNEPREPADCHIRQGLFNVPAADVVEVVRCKDCRKTTTSIINAPKGARLCITDGRWVLDDHFCSHGERKGEGG